MCLHKVNIYVVGAEKEGCEIGVLVFGITGCANDEVAWKEKLVMPLILSAAKSCDHLRQLKWNEFRKW